jgi:eukaryotic-like serine/threonine-protein kinase
MDVAPVKANASIGHGIPAQLGRYPLLRIIGKGSMGDIYESIDPSTGRRVALKTIRRDLLDDGDVEEFSALFRLEAQAGGRLTHPGIVSIYEYGEQDSFAYMAMEYVEGRSLREYLDQKLVFSIAQVVDIVSQLLNALQYAHDRGVWHRDIKPANILMTERGRVKVTDFGIAYAESSVNTPVGTILGTAGFIAPEMYLGEDHDGRVDVFAAGAVLYQLLTGIRPFVGSPETIMFKVCCETTVPPSMAVRGPSLRCFDAVVMQALARRPADRFSCAAHFLSALRQAHDVWVRSQQRWRGGSQHLLELTHDEPVGRDGAIGAQVAIRDHRLDGPVERTHRGINFAVVVRQRQVIEDGDEQRNCQ